MTSFILVSRKLEIKVICQTGRVHDPLFWNIFVREKVWFLNLYFSNHKFPNVLNLQEDPSHHFGPGDIFSELHRQMREVCSFFRLLTQQ